MCGISGAWGTMAEERLRAGLRRLEHRGPDGERFLADKEEQVFLGHRRLSILDTSSCGDQPFLYNGLAIVYNGEIYNFLEIRKELQGKGYSFSTETDTEVIVAAYHCWGSACLHRFNGMWSFVIWNKAAGEFFISRDRFGKKPLFYAFYKGCFLFGSEMKAVAACFDQVQVSSDFEWCKENVLRYEATEKCLIDGILRFPAGSFAFFKKGEQSLRPQRFWDTREQLIAVPNKYEDQVEIFRGLFLDACAIRMRSDVPIGTALSGGLDSSAVICSMAHMARHAAVERTASSWQHAFVACFKGTPLDERVYAEQVVQFLDIPAEYLEIDPVKGIESLSEYLWFFEELYHTSPVPMVELYRNIKAKGVTVSIDGHGADELMAGYRNDISVALLDAGLRPSKIRDILRAYKALFAEDNAQEASSGAGFDEWKRQLSYHLKGRKNVLRYVLRALVGIHPHDDLDRGTFGSYNSRLYELFHVTVLPTLLRNYDRYAMAAGVEVRMPFMDHRLVSFSFSLPWESKLRAGYTKSLIRDAARPYMPEAIVNRKTKIGFNTPIVDWIRGPWKTFLSDTLASAAFRQCSLIDADDVAGRLRTVIEGKNPNTLQGESVWYEMLPFFWEQSFLKKLNVENSTHSAVRL